jgi:hypothetical protein
MKLKNTKWIALLAVSGLAISTQSAKAVNNGDLIFGVRDASGAHNVSYEFDLGAPPPSAGTLASNLGADLTALFGANWYSNTNLQWSVIGYTPVNGLWSSVQESTYGTQSTDPWIGSAFGSGFRNATVTNIQSLDSAYAAGSDSGISGFTAGGTSAAGGVALNNGTGNSYAYFQPGGGAGYSVSWNQYNPSNEAIGFSGSALDIYLVTNTTAATSVYKGTFTVDSSGNVVFSTAPPSGATPEAGGALTLMSLGLGCLVSLRRRFVRA